MADDPMNIKSFITEKLSESMQNVDVMAMLQNLASSENAQDDAKERLGGILSQFSSMSDEEKQVFLVYVKQLLAKKLETHLRNNPPDLSKVEEALTEAVKEQLIYAAVIIFVVVVLVVFFGYKLYKSIKEKEKKREEKKKQKQMKKKK